MKAKLIAATMALTTVLLAGCGSKAADKTPTPTPAANTGKTDTVATASVVDNAADFEKAISKDGKWIIAVTKDVTTTDELVLDGTFKNGKKDASGNDAIQRKIALYTQDADHKVTARFTLTAPKLTINSPEARIQSGTFKGDVYVSAKDFQLVDAKIDGNLYFTTEEAQSTFKIDDKSSVTGTQGMAK
jgi:heat shock protein HslJ